MSRRTRRVTRRAAPWVIWGMKASAGRSKMQPKENTNHVSQTFTDITYLGHRPPGPAGLSIRTGDGGQYCQSLLTASGQPVRGRGFGRSVQGRRHGSLSCQPGGLAGALFRGQPGAFPGVQGQGRADLRHPGVPDHQSGRHHRIVVRALWLPERRRFPWHGYQFHLVVCLLFPGAVLPEAGSSDPVELTFISGQKHF